MAKKCLLDAAKEIIKQKKETAVGLAISFR